MHNRQYLKPILGRDNLPIDDPSVPFRKELHQLFFEPPEKDIHFAIHGPNVIRLADSLLHTDLHAIPGLLRGDNNETERAVDCYFKKRNLVMWALGMQDLHDERAAHTKEFLRFAALYHDIGKIVRRENHPQIGTNLLLHFKDDQRKLLVESLGMEHEEAQNKADRFSRLCSIVQHHDKFGVVSTGEGALPIFSDILYFKSNFDAIPGINRNVASVMLLNLADIAAVNVASGDRQEEAAACARDIGRIRHELATLQDIGPQRDSLSQLQEEKAMKLFTICSDPKSCLGLRMRKMNDVMIDFEILIEAIKDKRVDGNRGRLKATLLEIEQNPSRTISRIRRLLLEAAETTGCERLAEFFGVTEVESVLVGMLGGHQFQFFCEQFAAMVKLDYGLSFFKAVMCASALAHMHLKRDPKVWSKLAAEHSEQLGQLNYGSAQSLASAIVIRYVKVLRSLVSRYTGVIDTSSTNRRRFGFQLRDLTEKEEVREKIIDFLIDPNKEFAALTWIGDEVTVWSMD